VSLLWPSLASTDSDLSLGEDKQMTVQLFLHWSNSMLLQLSKQLQTLVVKASSAPVLDIIWLAYYWQLMIPEL
jgi:hypothetical protein